MDVTGVTFPEVCFLGFHGASGAFLFESEFTEFRVWIACHHPGRVKCL